MKKLIKISIEDDPTIEKDSIEFELKGFENISDKILPIDIDYHGAVDLIITTKLNKVFNKIIEFINSKTSEYTSSKLPSIYSDLEHYIHNDGISTSEYDYILGLLHAHGCKNDASINFILIDNTCIDNQTEIYKFLNRLKNIKISGNKGIGEYRFGYSPYLEYEIHTDNVVIKKNLKTENNFNIEIRNLVL